MEKVFIEILNIYRNKQLKDLIFKRDFCIFKETELQRKFDQPKLLPEAMAGSMTQLQQGFVLKFVAQVVTMANTEARDQDQRL